MCQSIYQCSFYLIPYVRCSAHVCVFFYNQVKILKQSLTPSLYHFYSLQLRSAHSKLHRSVSMATYKQYGCCLMLTYMFRLSSLLCSNLFRRYCRWPFACLLLKFIKFLGFNKRCCCMHPKLDSDSVFDGLAVVCIRVI